MLEIPDCFCIEIKKAYLPAEIFVVSVAHVQRFGGERIWLHLYVCAGNLVDETGFTNIREA